MKKRKFLLPILSVCMVVALVSVGFASWLITGNSTTGATGSFITYGVSNNYYTITAATTDTIKFGAPSGTASTTYNWLSYNDVEGESLTATVTLTLKSERNAATGDTVSTFLGSDNVTFTLSGTGTVSGSTYTADETSVYDTCVTSNYLAYPTFYVGNSTTAATCTGSKMKEGLTITLSASNFAATKTDKSAPFEATATVKITFAWGTATDSKNPYEHYNELDCNDNHSAATTLLDAVYALDGKYYQIALEVKSASSS